MSKVIGIDLGTTNSVAAILEGGKPVIIPNVEGGRLTPSVVAFTKAGERLVGQVAKRQAVSNPERTVSSIKRHMGSAHTIRIDGKDYTPQEISALVLGKIRQDCEAYLGAKVGKAVITVPAYFSDSQRQATKDAGVIAGLDVLRIINEPTAAALAYGLDKAEDQTVLVFDLGGGTFDVSILELSTGLLEVKATAGNNRLGGDDFDSRLANQLAEEFLREHRLDLRKDNVAMQRLLEAAEKAKVELSTLLTTSISLPFIAAGPDGPKHLETTLSRAKFQELTKDLVEKAVGPTKQALADAKLTPQQIDKVILVGGATRMPAVQEMVKNLLGKDPYKGVNPDEVVALGAAIQAGIIEGDVSQQVVLVDVTPLSLGIETLGGVFTRLIHRNSRIPTSKKEIFTTAADGQTSVDIHVLQGEREMAGGNKTLGRFRLDGLAPAPRGVPQVEVSFDIDVNGIVNVSAKDLATGKEQRVTITASTGLDKDDIDRLVKEAEQHAREDKDRREAAELHNHADSLIYNAEKAMKDVGDKAEPGQMEAVRQEAGKLRETLKGGDQAAIKAGVEALTKVLYELTAAAYQQSKPAGPEGAAPQGETVVDADYKMEDGTPGS